MSPRARLDDATIDAFVRSTGWAREEDGLVRSFAFSRYGDGLGFAVAVGVEADKADHHPDLFIGWCKVRVRWSTHDAPGITQRDLDLATLTDALASRVAS